MGNHSVGSISLRFQSYYIYIYDNTHIDTCIHIYIHTMYPWYYIWIYTYATIHTLTLRTLSCLTLLNFSFTVLWDHLSLHGGGATLVHFNRHNDEPVDLKGGSVHAAPRIPRPWAMPRPLWTWCMPVDIWRLETSTCLGCTRPIQHQTRFLGV